MIRAFQRSQASAGTVTTVVIGAGHNGLAMSYCLSGLGIDHVVLERGEVANSWRHERWDSLRLLTPNWQSRLPGHRYAGPDPDGFMRMAEVVGFLNDYARLTAAPLLTGTTVTCVRNESDGYRVVTDRGEWRCRAVVLASGAFNRPAVPALRQALPASLASVTTFEYQSPDQLDPGGVLVVGASATGVQLADEIQRSGRPVLLALGEHVRMPRTYRGRDVQWWMDAAGVLDERWTEVDDIRRARRVSSPQLVGSPDRATLDLNVLRQRGVELVGRLAAVRDGKALFSGSLRNHCALADLKLGRLLDSFDDWARQSGMHDAVDPVERFQPTVSDAKPRLGVDLAGGEIRTVLWATGYRPDYRWLDVPVLDRKGQIRHDGGVADVPGLYLMGLPFLRRRKSSFMHGADDDARELGAHLKAYLDRGTRRVQTAVG